MCRIVDLSARREAERDVDHDDHRGLRDEVAAVPVDRMVDPSGCQEDPEQPEDRAGRATEKSPPPKTKLAVEPAAAQVR